MEPKKDAHVRKRRRRMIRPAVERMKQEKSCGVILFRETKTGKEFLLLKYPEGHYDFPKGHVEHGEDELTTAKRELFEETGISNVTIFPQVRELLIYDFYARYDSVKGWIHKEVVYFVGRYDGVDTVILSDEHSDFIWVPEALLCDALTYDNARELFRTAMKKFYETSRGDIV